MALNLKAANLSIPSKPFSWDLLPTSPPSVTSSAMSMPSPPSLQLPAKDMKVFGALPLRAEFGTGLVRCKTCRKPFLRSCIFDHVENCKKIQALVVSPTKKGAKASDLLGVKKGGTKRKAEDEPEDGTPASKKKKPAAKVTKGRAKGPIDYDKHCGVINDKGLPCSRSLTCKSHSMGAKRNVQGRSRPYNDLLLDWQREHNPNFVEPVKRETKKEKKEKRDKEREEKRRMMDAKKAAAALEPKGKKKKGGVGGGGGGASKKAAAAFSGGPGHDAEGDEEMDEDIDSETELDAMLRGLRAAEEAGKVAVPLATYEELYVGSWFVNRRERLRCCRDQLLGALMGGRGGLGAVPGVARP